MLINKLYQTSGDTWSEAPSIKNSLLSSPISVGRSELFNKVFVAA
ncbi:MULTISPECIES: hypothetical protein [unclassified Arsenophonus]|nr:hypothetical protein [Arsenophonus sp.]